MVKPTLLRRRRPAQPRGVALVMVMAAVTVAGVIAYTALSSSARSLQAENYHQTTILAKTAAENGFSLAQHLLTHPEEAGRTLPLGYYNGSEGSRVDAGDGATFELNIVSLGDALYQVESTGRARNIDGGEKVAAVSGRIKLTGNWRPIAPLMLSDGQTISTAVTCTGDAASNGVIHVAGSVLGNIMSSNHEDYVNGTPPDDSRLISPPPSDLELVKAYEAGGYYLKDGVVKRGAMLTSSTLTNWDSTWPEVVFYDSAMPLTLRLNSSTPVTSTLVILNGGLVTEGNVTFNAPGNMPAVINLSKTQLNGSSATGNSVTVNGLLYLGDTIDTNPLGTLEVNGAVISNAPNTTLGTPNFASFIINAHADADVDDLTNVGLDWGGAVVEERKASEK